MDLTLDCPAFPYRGYHGQPAICRLRIYRTIRGWRPVVIATELAENPGTSITNAAESLATAVATLFRLSQRPNPPRRHLPTGPPVWIEHYPGPPKLPGAGFIAHVFAESFSRVDFEWTRDDQAKNPRWSSVTAADIEALVGHPVAEARP